MKLIGRNFELKRASEDNEENEVSMNWLMSGVDFQNRRIDIRSEINEVVAAIIIRAVTRMQELSSEPITINLSSPGGDVLEGLAIYDCLRESPCQIIIKASGKIMSMGFIIFLAGDVRLATPNTSFMMHSISYATGDSAKIVRHHEVDLIESKRLNNVLLEIMGSRTSRNKKWWYRTVILQDRYFSVAEAQEFGVLSLPKPVRKKPVRKVKNVRKKV